METGDVEPTFVDTNILVYATTEGASWHRLALEALERLYVANVPLWVSRQILREYLAALTRPQTFVRTQSPASLAADVRRFQLMFRIAEDGPVVTQNLLTLLDQFVVGGKQIHDANIVATMQAHGIRRLLTHNEADFARFAGVIEVLPLVPRS